MFLAVIYGHPDDMNTVVGKAIKKLYPGVFDRVVELNFTLGQGGLPRLMQSIESGVMIGRVAGRMVREYPNTPLLTVHDSVAVPPEHIGVVEDIIAEEWMAEFGMAPRTKTSSFTDPQVPRKRRKKKRGRRRRWWGRCVVHSPTHTTSTLSAVEVQPASAGHPLAA